MMTKSYLEGVIERMGEKAEIIIFARDALAYLDRAETAEAERDAVTVERDEAKEACDLLEMERDDACGKLDDLRADLHNVRAHSVAAEEARDLAFAERDEAYKQRDAAVHLGNVLAAERDEARRQRNVAEEERGEAVRGLRDASSAQRSQVSTILGKTDDESQVEAAHRVTAALAEARRERDEAQAKVAGLESMRAGVAYFACWPDGMLEALGATDVSGVADVMERVKALVGAERERDRLLRSEADVCAILGAAPDELLSDAARRAMSEPENVSDAANTLSEAFLIDDFGNSIEDLAKQAADQIASVRGSLLVPDDGMVAIHARDIRDSLAGERGATVAERVALVMAELRRLRAAEAEPPQVFRIQHEIAIAGDLVTIRVAPLRDPAIRALPLGVRLGLVVCDG